MTDLPPTAKTAPNLVKEWVSRNPYPIVVLREDRTVLSTNEAFADMLRGTELKTESILRQLLSTDLEPVLRGADLLEVLEDFQCVVKEVTLDADHRYMGHIIKPPMDGVPCLCCILVPESDPWHNYLRGVLHAVTSFVVEIDAVGGVCYINDPLLRHLGYTAADRSTLQHLQQLQPNFTQEQFTQWITEVKTGGVCRFETIFVGKDGRQRWMEASLLSKQLPGENSYLLTALDVTLRLTQELKLQDELAQANADGRALKKENARLRKKAGQAVAGNGLIYSSAAYAAVVDQMQQVAPTDATVLVTGETGTGKELIARTIHRLSKRSKAAFVTVDCGSLPAELIESELFGYEKGAFTGAYRDRMGRFEAADGGTIFLDEIGELPLLMQTRLLRVLQEGEFTPVGKTEAQRTDVRVIAATNRKLEESVRQGSFRADLFYRLNVFPIHSIPLRERKADIEPLLEHFISRFNQRFSKDLSGPDGATLKRLQAYDFPGNVRELENMVERAFIVSGDRELYLTVPTDERVLPAPILDLFEGQLPEFLPFEDYQRNYIELVLESTGGKVSGKDGAAQILRINPQTLFSKMRRLGIRH